jgi:hypothetical protein
MRSVGIGSLLRQCRGRPSNAHSLVSSVHFRGGDLGIAIE